MFGQGLELLSEIVKSVAALKLLQPAPLCVQIDGRAFLQGSGPFGRDRGRSLKRLHRPNRFRDWLHELKGENGSRYYYGFVQFTSTRAL